MNSKSHTSEDIPSHSQQGAQRRRRGRSRRLTAGTAAVAAALLLAACSGGSTSSDSSASGADTAATLQAATPQGPNSFDPCANGGGASLPFLDLLYVPLIYSVPSTNELKPGLASSWDFSGANKETFTVKLKSGYTFQDGTPVNAQAVVSSINYCLSEKVQSLPSLASLTAPDPQTVVFTLNSQTASLPAELSQNLGMIISPAAIKQYGVKELSNHPVGAGPFKLSSYVPNSSVSLTKWSGYKEAGEPAPKVNGIHVQIITDQNSLAAALKNGTVDYAFAVDSSIVPSLKSDQGLKVHINNGALAFTSILLNLTVAPVDNPDVRLAMEYGIDRKALAKVASDNVFTVPAFSIYPPGSPYYDASMANAWPYNPDKARQLLAQAGYPNGLTINGALSIAAPPFENDAVVVADQLKKVGITINWTQEQPAQALDQFNKSNGGPMLSVGWDGTVTPLSTYFALFSKDGSGNPGHAANSTIESALSQLQSAYTASGVMDLVRQMDSVIKSQALIIPLFYNPFPEVYSSHISGADQASSLEAEPNMDYLSVSS